VIFKDFEMDSPRLLVFQAYRDLFNNKNYRRTAQKTLFFDTRPFQKQYECGRPCPRDGFAFLQECLDTRTIPDLFAYDLDEPDFVAACRSSNPPAAFLDDASRTRAGRVGN